MASKLSAYLEELKQPVPEPPLEPDLDDVDEKIDTLLRCVALYSQCEAHCVLCISRKLLAHPKLLQVYTEIYRGTQGANGPPVRRDSQRHHRTWGGRGVPERGVPGKPFKNSSRSR